MGMILSGTELIVACFAFGTSLLFFMSPIIAIHSLYHKKAEVEQFSGVNIFFSFIHCILWFSLGIESNDSRLFWCNFIGVLLNFIWCVAYLTFFTSGKKMLFVAYLFSLINITIEALYFEGMLFSSKPKPKEESIDYYKEIFKWVISMIFNTMMYFTPGFNLKKLLRTKDYCYISIVSVYLGLVNAITWFVYGFVGEERKMYMIVANGIAILLCSMQIGLYYHFKNSTVEGSLHNNNNKILVENNDIIQVPVNDVNSNSIKNQ